jgi:hypothetical protein
MARAVKHQHQHVARTRGARRDAWQRRLDNETRGIVLKPVLQLLRCQQLPNREMYVAPNPRLRDRSFRHHGRERQSIREAAMMRNRSQSHCRDHQKVLLEATMTLEQNQTPHTLLPTSTAAVVALVAAALVKEPVMYKWIIAG